MIPIWPQQNPYVTSLMHPQAQGIQMAMKSVAKMWSLRLKGVRVKWLNSQESLGFRV